MKTLAVIVLLVAAGCGKQSSSKLYNLRPEALLRYVNPKPLPADPNLTLDKSLTNNSYPLQLALYQDRKFYYDLPNLADGTGTWRQEGGVLVLKASARSSTCTSKSRPTTRPRTASPSSSPTASVRTRSR
jgi:hypothetical protein